MYESPHEPGDKAAHLNSRALQYREILPHNGKASLVEITKWGQRRTTTYLAENGFRRILTLLHCDLRYPRQRHSVLIRKLS